jgi:dUTP pyrophosphatase
MAELEVGVERLAHAADLPLPAYATAGAAGLDLLAAVSVPVELEPMARLLVPTGIRLALPPGVEAQIRPRSGLALRHGVTVLNAPGTIDADYRGEIAVILVNLGTVAFSIGRGKRIAQMVFAPTARVTWREHPIDPCETDRSAGGFGSTGRRTRSAAEHMVAEKEV